MAAPPLSVAALIQAGPVRLRRPWYAWSSGGILQAFAGLITFAPFAFAMVAVAVHLTDRGSQPAGLTHTSTTLRSAMVGPGILVPGVVLAFTAIGVLKFTWPYFVALALFIHGVTAWAVADDAGVHWRFRKRRSLPWEQIATVQLTRKKNRTSQSSIPVLVLVDQAGAHHELLPVRSCGRHRRLFATALIAKAEPQGIPARVIGVGWNEPSTLTDTEDPRKLWE